jgi:hypothetical protein
VKPSHYSAVRRAAKKLCVKRMRTRAILWDLRPEYKGLTLWEVKRKLRRGAFEGFEGKIT